MTRKKNRIDRPAYIASVSRFPTAKLRRENSSSLSIGSGVRRSQAGTPRTGARRPPAAPGSRRSSSRSAVARSARRRSRRGRARTGPHPRKSMRREAFFVSRGTAARTSAIVAATSGTLSAKIQRHETWSTIRPPTSGPTIAPIPPHAVQAPIAAARSRWRKRGDDDRERARRQQRAGGALQGARRDQHSDRRRYRTRDREDAERGHADREHEPLAVDVRRASRRSGSATRARAGRRSRPTAAPAARRRGRAGSPAARR